MALALFAACKEEPIDNPGTGPEQNPEIIDDGETFAFTASLEQMETEDGSVNPVGLWKTGDEIKVSDGSVWAVFVATEVDGNNCARFEKKEGEPSLSKEAGTRYKAYYPVSMVQPDGGLALPRETLNANGDVSEAATAAGQQGSSFAATRFTENPMYAEAEGTELHFTNICGLIHFHITLDNNAVPGGEEDRALSQIAVYDASGVLCGPMVIGSNGALQPADSGEGGNNRAVMRNMNPKFISCVNDFYLPVPPAVYSAMDFLAVTNTKAIQSWAVADGEDITIERNKIHTVNLVLDDVCENDLSGMGLQTANCYTPKDISSGVEYRFRATKGCSSDLVPGIKSAGVLWRAQMTTSQEDADAKTADVIDNVSYKGGYIQFSTTNNQGNALIAAYDGEGCTGNIIWSWHIWDINSGHPLKDLTCPSGAVIMDRNIGALYSDTDIPADKNVENTASSRFSAGYIYQWGRKDPFMGRVNNGKARGFWKACSPERQLTIVNGGSPVSVETTIQNPNVFYGSTEGYWCSDAEIPTWDGPEKTIYDPCPPGYRVWSKSVFPSLSKSDFETNVHFISGTTYQNLGYNYKSPLADGQYIFLPVNGQYNNKTGGWSAYITQSRIWIRDVNSQFQTGFINFTNPAVENKATSIDDCKYSVAQPMCSSYGMAVRCQRIDTEIPDDGGDEPEQELLVNALPAMWEQTNSVCVSSGTKWTVGNKAYANVSTGKGFAYMSTFEAPGHSVNRSVVDEHFEAGNLLEGDGFLFTVPVKHVDSEDSFDFCATITTQSLDAPKYWIFEYYDEDRWKSVEQDLKVAREDSSVKYSFYIKADNSYAATFVQPFSISSTIDDGNLLMRIRVAGPINGKGELLTATPNAFVYPCSSTQKGCHIYSYHGIPVKDVKKVAVFGNSFTYNGSAPWILKRIARSQGHEMRMRLAVRSGFTFDQQMEHAQGRAVIDEGGYDFAIMQDQSEQHASYYSDGDQTPLESTRKIVAELKTSSPGIEPILENTWSYLYTNNYMGYGSYEAMDYALQMGCYEICRATGCTESPIGWAFQKARAAGIKLYSSDDKHPNRNGAYLKACVNYLIMYGERFDQNVTNEEIPAATAATLRRIAEEVVLDHKGDYIPAEQ